LEDKTKVELDEVCRISSLTYWLCDVCAVTIWPSARHQPRLLDHVFRLLPALAVVVFVLQHVEIWWCSEWER